MLRATPHRASPWAIRYRRLWAALPWLYCVWAVLVGSCVVWIMPPWQNADEPAHALRAVQIALGHPLGQRAGATAGGISDPQIIVSVSPVIPLIFHPEARINVKMLLAADAARWGHPAFAPFENTATYPPFLYASAVPAVWIGRMGRMSVAGTLHLMRLFNLLAAAALGFAALAVAQRTRLAIAAMLLLPMTLALAASASQDSVMIPLAGVSVGLIDRARQAPMSSVPLRRDALIALSLLLVMLARPPYLPLALLLLLLPGPGMRARIVLAIAIAGLTVLWAAYVLRWVSVPMHGADAHGHTIFLLEHPFSAAGIFWHTLVTKWRFYLDSGVGGLGWLDVSLPPFLLNRVPWVLLLALLSAATPDPVRARLWGHRAVLGGAAVLASVLAIFVALYLTWTPPGSATIEGVQGRYFLPLLPALALATPSLGRWAPVLRPPALAAVLALAAVTPAVMLTAIVNRYYLMP